jgi:hypothetical protein
MMIFYGKENIPIAILSIPTINKTIERIWIAARIEIPGYRRTYPDSIIDITPVLIGNTLSQAGVFTICNMIAELSDKAFSCLFVSIILHGVGEQAGHRT